MDCPVFNRCFRQGWGVWLLCAEINTGSSQHVVLMITWLYSSVADGVVISFTGGCLHKRVLIFALLTSVMALFALSGFHCIYIFMLFIFTIFLFKCSYLFCTVVFREQINTEINQCANCTFYFFAFPEQLPMGNVLFNHVVTCGFYNACLNTCCYVLISHCRVAWYSIWHMRQYVTLV